MAAEQRRQLMLEAAGLDRAVHPALLGCARLPPPSPCPRVIALGDRARARRASDRPVAAVVKRIVGDIVGANIIPYFGLGPIGERRELYDRAVIVIDFDLADIGARRPLVAAKSCDPGVEVYQRAPQRQHLAHLATEQTQVDVAVEQIVTVPR